MCIVFLTVMISDWKSEIVKILINKEKYVYM